MDCARKRLVVRVCTAYSTILRATNEMAAVYGSSCDRRLSIRASLHEEQPASSFERTLYANCQIHGKAAGDKLLESSELVSAREPASMLLVAWNRVLSKALVSIDSESSVAV